MPSSMIEVTKNGALGSTAARAASMHARHVIRNFMLESSGKPQRLRHREHMLDRSYDDTTGPRFVAKYETLQHGEHTVSHEEHAAGSMLEAFERNQRIAAREIKVDPQHIFRHVKVNVETGSLRATSRIFALAYCARIAAQVG